MLSFFDHIYFNFLQDKILMITNVSSRHTINLEIQSHFVELSMNSDSLQQSTHTVDVKCPSVKQIVEALFQGANA